MKKLSIETKVVRYDLEELPDRYKDLIEYAKKETQKAYVPYSEFHVGVSILLKNGEIVLGNNQENAAYPSGLCAERTAMFYANSQYPDTPVEAMAIAAYYKGQFLDEPITPCGACRQVLLETEHRFKRDIKIFLYGQKCVYVVENATQLLPLSFTKNKLDE